MGCQSCNLVCSTTIQGGIPHLVPPVEELEGCNEAWLLAASQTTLFPVYSSAFNSIISISYCWEIVKERCSELPIILIPTLIWFSLFWSSSRAVTKSLLDSCRSVMMLESLTWQKERQHWTSQQEQLQTRRAVCGAGEMTIVSHIPLLLGSLET